MKNASVRRRAALCGAAAGAVNGLFGAGGGILLLPLLSRLFGLEDRVCLATSLGILLPLSALSAAIWLLREPLPPLSALPYLAGGVLGGLLAGRWLQKLPAVWLRRAFALLLILSGIRGVLAL